MSIHIRVLRSSFDISDVSAQIKLRHSMFGTKLVHIRQSVHRHLHILRTDQSKHMELWELCRRTDLSMVIASVLRGTPALEDPWTSDRCGRCPNLKHLSTVQPQLRATRIRATLPNSLNTLSLPCHYLRLFMISMGTSDSLQPKV